MPRYCIFPQSSLSILRTGDGITPLLQFGIGVPDPGGRLKSGEADAPCPLEDRRFGLPGEFDGTQDPVVTFRQTDVDPPGQDAEEDLFSGCVLFEVGAIDNGCLAPIIQSPEPSPGSGSSGSSLPVSGSACCSSWISA